MFIIPGSLLYRDSLYRDSMVPRNTIASYKYSLKESLQVPPSTMNNLVFRPRSKHHERVSEMVPKGRIMIGRRQLLYCLGNRSVLSFKRSSANLVNFDTNERVIPTLFKEGEVPKDWKRAK